MIFGYSTSNQFIKINERLLWQLSQFKQHIFILFYHSLLVMWFPAFYKDNQLNNLFHLEVSKKVLYVLASTTAFSFFCSCICIFIEISIHPAKVMIIFVLQPLCLFILTITIKTESDGRSVSLTCDLMLKATGHWGPRGRHVKNCHEADSPCSECLHE